MAIHSIVTISKVSATFAGVDISSITEFEFSHHANSVPTLTLVVASSQDVLSDDVGIIDGVGLVPSSTLYHSIRKYVKSTDSTLSFSCTLRVHGESGSKPEDQTIAVSGWVLVDVAMAPISIGTPGCVRFTFAHPLAKASFGGGTIPGLVDAEVIRRPILGADVRSNYISALNAYVDVRRSVPMTLLKMDGAAEQSTVQAVLKDRFKAAIRDFESNTTSSKDLTLPALKSGLSAYVNDLMMSMESYAYPTSGSSVLGRFLSSVVPEYSLSLGGDYTKPLEVAPFSPWASPKFSLSDEHVIRVDLPTQDPCPLSGVRVVCYDRRLGDSTSYYSIDGSQAQLKGVDHVFMPQAALARPQLYGPIHQFAEPGWLQGTRMRAATRIGASSNAAKAASSGYAVTSKTSGPNPVVPMPYNAAANAGAVNVNSAIVAAAKAYYVTSFCKDWTFSVHTRVLFSLDGDVLHAGAPIELTSQGKSVMRGYITGVSHRVQVLRASASTAITCSHAYFDGKNVPEEVKGFGEKNGLYS